jgi:tetratricopeptide (TPR) repeat protein
MRALAALLIVGLGAAAAAAQTPIRPGSRIVTLRGFGDYYTRGPAGRVVAVSPDGFDVEAVAVVDRIEGDRIWIRGAAGGAVGWVPAVEAVALADAVRHFGARIARDPMDWDAHLRRAEAALADGRLEDALTDYAIAATIAPERPILYLRRGRLRRTMGDCRGAADDFARTFALRADWPEPSHQAARILADCPDAAQRDPKQAIALAQQALTLDLGHPPYLTTLALAYFRDAQIDQAIATQRQALDHPLFPTADRSAAEAQLRLYEQAAAARPR